jgi:hypothetical protein
MIGKDMNNKLLTILFCIIGVSILIFVIRNKTTHTDIVIKTDTEEFIINDYYLDKNCIYFVHDGDDKTICGNYEIID